MSTSRGTAHLPGCKRRWLPLLVYFAFAACTPAEPRFWVDLPGKDRTRPRPESCALRSARAPAGPGSVVRGEYSHSLLATRVVGEAVVFGAEQCEISQRGRPAVPVRNEVVGV